MKTEPLSSPMLGKFPTVSMRWDASDTLKVSNYAKMACRESNLLIPYEASTVAQSRSLQ